MNKTYRSVWSEALGTWVAASEISKARGKRSKPGLALRAVAAGVLAVASGVAGAQAVGSGSAVAHSTAISSPNCADGAQATTKFSIAIGCASKASDDSPLPAFGATAVGTNSTASGQRATALGAGSLAAGDFTTAIGGLSNADAPGAQALGYGNQATGKRSVVAGYNSAASALDAVAVGSYVVSSGEESLAAGNYAIAGANGSVALGFKAQATAVDSTTLGHQAQASEIGAVAVGTGAQATAVNSIALGDHAIANGATLGVAAYVPVDGLAVAGTAPVGELSIGKSGSERRITNVAAGASATDAVNVNQLSALADATVQYDVDLVNGSIDYDRITLNGDKSTTITNLRAGDLSESSTDAVNGSQLYATNLNVTNLEEAFNHVVGDRSTSHVEQNGVGIRYVRTNETTLPESDAYAEGEGSTAVGYEAKASGFRSLAMGYQAKAGSDLTIASGNNALATGTAAVAIGANTTATGGGAIAIGDGSRAEGGGSIAIAGSGGIFDGTASVDAVSHTGIAIGYVRTNEGTNPRSDAFAEGEGSTAVGYEAHASAENAVAMGFKAESSHKGSVAVGYGDYAQAFEAKQGTAMGHSARVTSDRGVALGAGSVATREGMNGQAEAISGVAVSSTQGAVSVGSEGNERQITNVAGGTQATDAVNLRQLQAVENRSVQYDTHEDGTVNHNQVTLGGDTINGGTRIRNVAPGVEGHDAVNVDQLNAGIATANQYTDAKVGDLQRNIDGVAKDASAAAAGAMAMAGLPQSTIPGKGMLSAAVAGYDGQGALAVGLSKMSDNARWVVKFSGTANSRGKVGVAAGVGFHW